MIRFEEALQIVLDNAMAMPCEKISFMSSAGRVLSKDIASDIDIPPFDKSAVDGYACRSGDLDKKLVVLEVISAGKHYKYPVSAGTCSKVMTGAPVPAGADFVFMIEDSAVDTDGRVSYTGKGRKDNISRAGEDAHCEDIVLKKGKIIRPQEVAVMASVGCTLAEVACRPGIGIISTGSELVEPSSHPGISQIRNSNAYQLLAQVERSGAAGRYYGIASDDEEVTYNMLSRALEENDVVLLTGGVSVGDFDFVPIVFERLGIEVLFDKIAVQPGKPTTFGLHNGTPVFGLPGNPVSSFIQFELLVRPLIMKMMGADWKPLEWRVALGDNVSRKSSSRMGLLPVRINSQGLAVAVEYHGSAHLSALPEADGIIAIPVGISHIEKGAMVNVRQI